jgi:hypothetical protein
LLAARCWVFNRFAFIIAYEQLRVFVRRFDNWRIINAPSGPYRLRPALRASLPPQLTLRFGPFQQPIPASPRLPIEHSFPRHRPSQAPVTMAIFGFDAPAGSRRRMGGGWVKVS